MSLRGAIACLLFFVLPSWAIAAETINNFDVAVVVERDGDIVVTETITVTAEGQSIRRGIFRDLVRYYEKDGARLRYKGARLRYKYDIRRVRRNGEREPYAVEKEGNAVRIRIGDADVFLPHGEHIYEIEYLVKNQVRYFDDYDEIYWNATGNYWAFPIEKARAVVTLPQGAAVTNVSAYTGLLGDAGSAYDYRRDGDAHIFTTTSRLPERHNLTVAVGIEKGVIDAPSASDKRAEWLERNLSALILFGAVGALSLFYTAMFRKVGRDPIKGPVFPHYEPPEGYSPAAVHQIYNRRVAGHKALIATLMHLAVKDRIKIDSHGRKKTVLKRIVGEEAASPFEVEATLEQYLFDGGKSVTLDDKYNANFTDAYDKFRKTLTKKYGAPYFKWNVKFLIAGVVFSILAVNFAISSSVGWTAWHTAAVIALVILSAVFSYLMPAPSPLGQKVRTQVEGFRLYLKTAEKLQLNSVKVGSDAPPPMTVERYEKFLPYAIALGVERPWTKHFERLIPEDAANYQPRWGNLRSGNYDSVSGLNKALMSSLSSGVSSSLPQSSSSSGSGGGGFSGGGGGGGGGGGW